MIKDITPILEKVAKTILQWGKTNVVTYDIAKTKIVFFSKLHQQRLNKQLQKTKIKVENIKIMFNKKAT